MQAIDMKLFRKQNWKRVKKNRSGRLEFVAYLLLKFIKSRLFSLDDTKN